MKKLVSFVILFVAIPAILNAQGWEVSGTITDQWGYGIPNVEVKYINEYWGDEWIDTTDASGNYLIDDPVTIIGENSYSTPSVFELMQNYPNPFNPTTIIPFSIDRACDINLYIYNIIGQKVKNIYSGYLSPGTYSVSWNGTNSNGEGISAGIYIYQLTTAESSISRKMVLLDGHSGRSSFYENSPVQSAIGVSTNSIEENTTYGRSTDQYNVFTVNISGQYIEPYSQSNITFPVSGGNVQLDYSNIYNKLLTRDFTSSYVLQASHSPYYLQGNVDVEENVILTIEPDVEFRVINGRLRIKGTLHADGTSSSPYETRIFFRPDVTPGQGQTAWTGIEFEQEANSSSTMKYCDISYANVGIDFDDGPLSMTITDCWISYCNQGIVVDGCELTLHYTWIHNCYTRGIYVVSGAFLDAFKCEFGNNYIGVKTTDSEEIHYCNFETLDYIFLQNEPNVYVNVQNNWWSSPNPSNWGVYITYPEWANYEPWLDDNVSDARPRQ
ncbi:MAG: T9SS type A sorting domain-containing protein [FCB group bacterium]|nr:T9SS type A sorting domain-containing protein [FCB group bacterium]